MTHELPTAAPGLTQPNSSILPRTIVWVAVQLVALLLAGMNVSLWARGSLPGNRFAISFMLVAQVAMSSLLFPWLLSSTRAGVVMVSVAVAFVGVAGLVEGAGLPKIVEAGLGVAIWLVALRLWSERLKHRTARLLGVLGASWLAIGSATFAYFWLEFREGTLPHTRLIVWSVVLSVLVSALVAHLIARRGPSDKFSTI